MLELKNTVLNELLETHKEFVSKRVCTVPFPNMKFTLNMLLIMPDVTPQLHLSSKDLQLVFKIVVYCHV